MRRFNVVPWCVLLWALCPIIGVADDDVATYRAWVQVLAAPEMDGRGPGTVGIERARDWLAERLRKMGLRPGFGDSYVQPFEANLGVVATRQMLASNGREARPESDVTVMGFSATGAFEGEAMFVGYGIVAPEHDYDSFASLGDDGLNGKVAIAFRYEPMDDEGASRWAKGSHFRGWSDAAALPNKARWAAQRGAAALLVVNPPGMDNTSQLRPTAMTAFESNAAIPVMHVSSQWLGEAIQAGGIDDPRAFLKEMQRRADGGKDQPGALAGVMLKGDVAIERRKATLHNVAAVWPGRGDLAKQWLIIGAHYDHLGYGDLGSLAETKQIHPGADDNASGAAGVLLLAQHLAHKPRAEERLRDEARDSSPDISRRSILFILFSGEERGLLGSMHFARHMHDMGLSADNVVAMLNLDMVGRLRDDRLHVFGVDTGDGLRDIVKQAGKAHDLKITTSGSGLGASDHTAFYFKRIPSLHFFTGNHEQYHRPSDTADLINAEGGVKVAALIEDIALQLSTRRTNLAFVEAKDDHAGGMVGMHGPGSGGAFLGIMPDYATLEGADGCGLTGVTPGSPAESAGLKEGDLVTAWNDTPIGNVRDLTAALAKSKPGDSVTLKVKRGEQVIELPVKLGSR